MSPVLRSFGLTANCHLSSAISNEQPAQKPPRSAGYRLRTTVSGLPALRPSTSSGRQTGRVANLSVVIGVVSLSNHTVHTSRRTPPFDTPPFDTPPFDKLRAAAYPGLRTFDSGLLTYLQTANCQLGSVFPSFGLTANCHLSSAISNEQPAQKPPRPAGYRLRTTVSGLPTLRPSPFDKLRAADR
jgi:hypothetical protein